MATFCFEIKVLKVKFLLRQDEKQTLISFRLLGGEAL